MNVFVRKQALGSKFTAALRGLPCDSTAFLYFMLCEWPSGIQGFLYSLCSIIHKYDLIRAACCDNTTSESLCFAAVSFFLSFFFLFSTRSPQSTKSIFNGSKLRSYFLPFVDQSSPHYVSRCGRDRSLQHCFPIVDIPISDHVAKFRGYRPRDCRDLMLSKKETAEEEEEEEEEIYLAQHNHNEHDNIQH